MRRMLALLLPMVLATFLLSCGPFTPRSMISWVDFIQFDDIFYLGTGDSYNLTLSDLGPQHGEVLFRVEGNIHNEKYHNKDGDAAFHDPGTLVYTLKGYKPEFRLAILEENRVRIYEANRNPKAVKGADLFDLENKVEYITVNSKDGSTVLGTIDNPQIVDDLVAMTLAAGLSQIAPRTALSSIISATTSWMERKSTDHIGSKLVRCGRVSLCPKNSPT